MYHRIAEAFKWAYAERTDLGDPADPEITKQVNEVSCKYLAKGLVNEIKYITFFLRFD